MKELMNSEIFHIIIIVVAIIVGGYFVGRGFTKGFFKELDLYLGKKFTDRVNNNKSKQKENGTKEKK